MTLHRRNPKRDANEKDIVTVLESIGVLVRRLSDPGVPDLLLYHWREGVILAEVKTAGGKLTKAQQESAGASLPFVVIRSVTEALELFGVKDA